jgi:hypothetical protein
VAAIADQGRLDERLEQSVGSALHGGLRRANRPMDQMSARSSRSCGREGTLDNTLIFYMQDNGGCCGEHWPRSPGATSQGD